MKSERVTIHDIPILKPAVSAIFETSVDVGWNLLAPVGLSIQREAIRLNLVLEPFPFFKISPIISIPVKVSGSLYKIGYFKKFLSELEIHHANKT